MATARSARPGKLPVQSRSKETVSAILEAAARILSSEGSDRFNTNRVAQAAGVSVGSLYQYFPNKQAMVRSLLGLRLRRAEEKRPPELRTGADVSLEVGIRASVAWHIELHREDPQLEQALNMLAYEVLEEGELEQFERRYERAIQGFLSRHRKRLRVADLDVAAFLVMQTLHASLNRAVVHHREALADGRLERELAAMILRYLMGGEPGVGGRRWRRRAND